MNSKSLGVLTIVTAVVAVLAYWAVRDQSPKTAGATKSAESAKTGAGEAKSPAAGATGKMLPVLDSKVNEAAEISVRSKDNEVTLKKSGTSWVIVSKSGYPAQFDKIKDALVGLAELTIVDSKTSKPDNYEYLGVTDLDAKNVKDVRSRLVTVKDASGQALASVIVGDTAPGRGTGLEAGSHVYVRRTGEAQTYEAKSRIDVRSTLDPDPMSWLTREVNGLTSDRVKSVTVSREGGDKIVIFKDKKEEPDYKLANMPAGRELKYAGALAPVATASGLVNFDDVAKVADVAQGGTPVGTAEYTTWDGLVLTAETSTKDGKSWVTFAARYDEPDPVPSDQPPPEKKEGEKTAADLKKEADELNAKLGSWAFSVPEYKAKQIVTTLDELLKPEEKKPETPAAPAAADEPSVLEKPEK
jgi:hypothetical protein